MKSIEVVAAIIIKDGKFLVVQRGKAKFDYVSYKWEFPGGKVETDETLKQAISREILEELHIHIKPIDLFVTVEHTYPDFHLVMHCFICAYEYGDIELTEHIRLAWLNYSELHSVDWAEADKPVLQYLSKKGDLCMHGLEL
ncbi:(deoxy)nucleoside triphosphate pyrophosphohydrolase [Acinetobacter sp. Marseille-Q1618]|uniref:(deoxy)nucleoside triphosphate pyrophosphohydrolase n=1 Tax=Acinetobacter sp. Marseille-Q1618 TaxID=2697502 RepID=UPI00156DB6C3|nr:(deoxy)nucleoside triphosphate pyrophosphohydrolase [Acinetobacter sp. Marseille-Q1618]